MNDDLKKNWKGLVAGMSLLTAPVQAHAGNPQHSDVKFDLHTLHPDLHPIATLESSNGRNMAHKAGPGHDEYNNAVGLLGFKPKTAAEEYGKSKHLQKLFPNLHDKEKFLHELKSNPSFYNALAASHWNGLKNVFGNINKTVYAWRHGRHQAINTADAIVQNDPYVKKYREIAGHLGKSEWALSKALAIIPVGKETYTGYDYNHLLTPEHAQQGYSLIVRPRGAELYSELRYKPQGEQRGYKIGSVEGRLMPEGNVRIGYSRLGYDNEDNKHIYDPALHRGKGLGQAMYEALLAHAKNKLGAKKAVGDLHSTMASRVHQKLAEKHGFDYKPQVNTKAPPVTDEAFDDKMSGYQYELKKEPEMGYKDLTMAELDGILDGWVNSVVE